MDHRIIGTILPVLEITLKPGERITSLSGELSWMSSSIRMETSTQMGTAGIGGLMGRLAGGASLFYTDYSAENREGFVAFASKVPGQILTVPLQHGQTCMVHRHGFLCATPGIEVNIAIQQNLGGGIFGGNGFIMQKLSGHGQAFVELSGEIVSYDLADGEELNVHPGHVGMLGANVRFELTRIKGIKNILFGGDGLFLAKLTGPGRVWLQSTPIANLAHALAPYLLNKN